MPHPCTDKLHSRSPRYEPYRVLQRALCGFLRLLRYGRDILYGILIWLIALYMLWYATREPDNDESV
jgi:hypothetical protein